MLFNIETDDRLVRWYDSIDEMMRTAVESVPEKNRSAFGATQDASRGFSWWGCHGGPAGVRELVRDPTKWPKLPEIRQMADSFQTNRPVNAQRLKRRRVRGAVGDELDIHRVRAGDLDRAWSTTVRDKRADGPRFITLVVNSAVDHRKVESQVAWRGIAATVVADALERSGLRVRILRVCSVLTVDAADRSVCFGAVLKRYDERLDFDRVALTVALSGFHRLFDFAAICSTSSKTRKDLGFPDRSNANIPAFVEEYFKVVGLSDEKFVTMDSEVYDRNAATREINRKLRELGVKE